MDTYFVACLGIIFVKCGVKSFHIIVKTGPGHTLNGNDSKCVFITHLYCLVDIKRGMFFGKRHLTHLDIPQSGKFFPYHLIACRDYEIWFVIRFAGFFTSFNPTLPGSYTAEHTCF